MKDEEERCKWNGKRREKEGEGDMENIGKLEVNKAKERVTHKHRVEKAHKR